MGNGVLRIIAGDIGGTKTLLEMSDVQGGHTQVVARHRYDSSAYESFSQIIGAFLSQYDDPNNPSCHHACFGVAGPIEVSGDKTVSKLTNLSWFIDSSQLKNQFKFKKVCLINDFSAVGHGVSLLDSSELQALQAGKQIDKATRLVIGAGTGLGVAQLVWCSGRYQVLATEGGHIDFSPRNAIQVALLNYVTKEQGRAACEDILSGPGLVTTYRFLHDYRAGDPAQLTFILQQEDIAAAVATAADKGEDSLAVEAMDIFVSVYGATAGNFALSSMALGGVYIAGGIAPKIVDHLKTDYFLEAFNDKGKMEKLNRQIPVAVVMNPEVGLIGCRHLASTP